MRCLLFHMGDVYKRQVSVLRRRGAGGCLYGVNRVVYRAGRAVKEAPEGREIGQGLSAGGYWRGTISAGRSRFLFAGGRSILAITDDDL